jgi:transcription antitermination factor NusG
MLADEHNYVMNGTYNLVAAADAMKLHIGHLFPKFVELHTTEKALNKSAVKSDYTVKVKNGDIYRDLLIRIATEWTATATLHFVPEIAGAATVVKNILDRYGNLARKSLPAETASLSNCLDDIYAVRESVEKIPGLLAIIDETKRANDVVAALLDSRRDEKTEKGPLTLKDVRVQIGDVFVNMMNTVNVFALIEATPEITEFITKQNALIDYVEDVVARRLGKKKTGKKEEDEYDPDWANKPIPETPETPDAPVAPDDYPDAIEWVANFGVANATDGMIFYIMVDGAKVFYKLLDRAGVGFVPGGTKYQELWEKL